MPGPATPLLTGGSPTCADRSSACNWAMRPSCLPCSSRAAWYPPFSRRSPSSRRSLISFPLTGRLAMSRSSSFDRRSHGPRASQATFAAVVDLLRHDRTVGDEPLQFLRQAVVGLLSEPGDFGVVGRGHGGTPEVAERVER